MEVLNLINGELVPSRTGKWLGITDPSCGEVYGKIPRSNDEDVDIAVDAAKGAFENWAGASIEFRAGCVEKLADLVKENADLLAKA